MALPECQETPDQLRAQGKFMLRELRLHLLTLQQLLVAEAVVKLSLCLGKPAARIPVKKHFALALAVDAKDVGDTLDELKILRIVQPPAEGAEDQFYVPLPDSKNWGVDIRTAAAGERKRLVELAWKHLLHAQRCEQLDNELASEPSLDDALSEISRAEAAKHIQREVALPSLPPTHPAEAGPLGAPSPVEPAQPRLAGLTSWQAHLARLMNSEPGSEAPATSGPQTPSASGSREPHPDSQWAPRPSPMGAAPIDGDPPDSQIGAAPISNVTGRSLKMGAAPIDDPPRAAEMGATPIGNGCRTHRRGRPYARARKHAYM